MSKRGSSDGVLPQWFQSGIERKIPAAVQRRWFRLFDRRNSEDEFQAISKDKKDKSLDSDNLIDKRDRKGFGGRTRISIEAYSGVEGGGNHRRRRRFWRPSKLQADRFAKAKNQRKSFCFSGRRIDWNSKEIEIGLLW
ncbi:hypothetical protein U1Q18_050009, partial [Sarracenia purpurea var. burkii]